jgi:hypothetical protein
MPLFYLPRVECFLQVQWMGSADDQRNLPLDPRGIDPHRAPMRIRSADGVRPQVLMVRYTVRLYRRSQDDD